MDRLAPPLRRRSLRSAALLSALGLLVAPGLDRGEGSSPAWGALEAQTLRGGAASLDRQNHQAQAHNFTYLATANDVRRYVELGYLVPVTPNRDFDVHNVSFPYARPEVRLFIERLASQYRSACGEKLVVTSLTRPQSNQPWNASSRSVHPTGMAIDLRRPANTTCRNWLERTLLSLEGQGVIEAIYERNPPHYHVAVYPQPYAQYVARITGSSPATVVAASVPQVQVEYRTHTVARGETLSRIGERYGVAVSRIRADNSLRGDRINVGQQLRIATYREVTRVAEAPAQSATPTPSQAATSQAAPAASQAPASQAPTASNLPTRVAEAEAESESAPALDGGGPDGGSGAAASRASGSPGSEVTHTVARGESLWVIAQRYGTSEVAIRAANDLSSTRIMVGQELRIPPASAELPSTLRHTVQRGESLWIIARRHGTTVDTLTRANGLRSTELRAGQVIEVPVSR